MTETAAGVGSPPVPPETLAKNISGFALDLYRRLRGSGENLFVSPYGVWAALSIASAGARGNTDKQMASVLHPTLPGDSIHVAFAELQAGLGELREAGNIELIAANSVWPQNEYLLLGDYVSDVKRNYMASVMPLRFSDAPEAAREAINQWAARSTDGKIKDLIQPGVLDATTRLVIANAIYFRGEWASRFKADATRQARFFLSPGKTVQAAFMRQESGFRHGDFESVQVLELPYRGEKVSMLILLPRDRNGLEQLEQDLSVERLSRWRTALKRELVEVLLPKFRITSSFKLNKDLAAMGMTDAFIPGKADFSGMDGRPGWLYIGAVLHKTFVNVDEEGTEAAAAAAVLTPPTAAPGQPPLFRADHPFVFAVCEARTGTLLFLGRVTDPTKSGE